MIYRTTNAKDTDGTELVTECFELPRQRMLIGQLLVCKQISEESEKRQTDQLCEMYSNKQLISTSTAVAR